MLSNTCKYAIRAMLYLEICSNKEDKIGVKKIAEELDTPQPFLAKILQQLSRNGLLTSLKGPTGGFYLSEENKKNAIWDIIKCIDGEDKFMNCFMGLEICDEENPCPVHFTVSSFRKRILKDFKDKSISEFVRGITEKGKHVTLNNFDII